jgi:hypothetical protein
MRIIFVLLFLLVSLYSESQSIIKLPKSEKKGEMYVYWGWNREWFTPSNMHFTGASYDFVLSDVKAKDKPAEFDIQTYFNLEYFTIPQYNFRIGYFIKDHYHISLAVDHMKYVVQQQQMVKIDGKIAGTDTDYDRAYNNETIQIKPGFLELEHTDGLNYGHFEFGRFDDLFKYKKVVLGATESVGTGLYFPKTDAHLLGNLRHDKYHVSGLGINTTFGLNLKFFNHIFIQSELKFGYVNMPDIKTTYSNKDKASQSFYFTQFNVTAGYSFQTKRKTTSLN